MGYYIGKKSKIISMSKDRSVHLALNDLKRDMEKVFLETDAGTITENPDVCLNIRLTECETEPECFLLSVEDGCLNLGADSHLGFIYGIYEISRRFLGISNFWFWYDQEVKQVERVPIPEDFRFESRPFLIRLRGWFVNDEVLLHRWSVGRDPAAPWQMVFETLLRCGGNMIIPGTDKNSAIYRKPASDRGLFITHHHAEPLGAEMFARAYPTLHPSYDENSSLFQELWRQGIESQKDYQMVWNLGFRGQGDCPFWENDPKYASDESRGKLMSQLIGIQYQMVKEQDPQALCCTNLYGETMELYKKGFLHLPEDVIHIWADNGFGKMVSRRQDNHNPRIPALPEKGAAGHHGIYYHVSFYDLQAANHITMLPNSIAFVEKELKRVIEHGATDYWIINCSNVKPHVFYLDFISHLWKDGAAESTWAEEFVRTYFGTDQAEKIKKAYLDFSRHAIRYGKHEDDHAGEQFANHVARILMTQFMRNREKRAEELLWATNRESLKAQVDWYDRRCEEAVSSYGNYAEACEKLTVQLSGGNRTLFEDTIGLQAKILYHSYMGAKYVCASLNAGFAEDYKKAFYLAGKAMELYDSADFAMRAREHGTWNGFYQNECLTDVKQSGWVAETLMGYFRILGDGPHFYQWQREFLNSEEDRRVMLILNFENHLTHKELFGLMKEKWEK